MVVGEAHRRPRKCRARRWCRTDRPWRRGPSYSRPGLLRYQSRCSGPLGPSRGGSAPAGRTPSRSADPGFTRFVVADELDRNGGQPGERRPALPHGDRPGPRPPVIRRTRRRKVLAVFGRGEARDYVDLMSIEPRFGLTGLFELAREKDCGFSPVVFTEMLDRFQRLRRDEFPIDDVRLEEHQYRVQVWRVGALELSSPEERSAERSRARDTGMDLGTELRTPDLNSEGAEPEPSGPDEASESC
jgi:hypothetical protein